jgi:spermidine/putrescine-binding protein
VKTLPKTQYVRVCLVDPDGIVIDEVIGNRQKANKFIAFCMEPGNKARYKGCWLADATIKEIDL